MAKALKCGFEVSEFELYSSFYVHFRTYVLAKGMNIFTQHPTSKYYNHCPSTKMALSLNNLR